MKKLLFILCMFSSVSALCQLDSAAVRGLCVSAPDGDQVDRFVSFIQEELAPRRINTLVLRVDHNYAYASHPELRDKDALTRDDVKAMVAVCKRHGINLIPQINLLGHQSWAGELGNLLKVYPQFDETPSVEMPDNYAWPNDNGLYCKSYCPLHPDVHAVVFDLVDEIIEVFEATAFHAGMDEVFYIGMDECPRCQGRDNAELFALEVNKIYYHLASEGTDLWIWGDRLIDGKTTGIGMWEASLNNTHRALDLIPQEVVINDWHYEQANPTASYFALKGFDVISCPWRRPTVAAEQVADYIDFKQHANATIGDRYLGFMQTYWSSAQSFMDIYHNSEGASSNESSIGAIKCFKELFPRSTR